MNWSDAARQLDAEAERQRLFEQRERERLAYIEQQKQLINRRVQQFLAAMKQAGNPGLKRINGRKGWEYWERGSVGFVRGFVSVDGTYGCNIPDDSRSGRAGNADEVTRMLADILRKHNVPLPEGD